MASIVPAFLCALLALVLWTGVGWVFARRVFGEQALALPLAPALGWAVQTVAALAAAHIFGFTLTTCILATMLPCGFALVFCRPFPTTESGAASGAASFPMWILLLAGLVALAPAAAVMPKFSDNGVILAAAIFDHSKVALVDEILRAGVPPGNPVYAEGGTAGHVAYYYLWHFSAAELARVTGASGWEADIAVTWFTAFASLSLMCGLAFHFAQRAVSPLIVLALALCGSLRPALIWVFGPDRIAGLLQPASGLAGWLFQTSWSPHHIASACCVLLATLIMARLSRRPSAIASLTLAMVLAAGFESSIWVGGIGFALAGAAVAIQLLTRLDKRQGMIFLSLCFAAGLAAAVLASPLIAEQIQAALSRGEGFPVAVNAMGVLGPLVPEVLRRWLDSPAYWLVFLVVEFPAIFVTGIVMLAAMTLSKDDGHDRKSSVVALAVYALVSLACGGLLVSTLSENNDLGWRAILPGIMVLTVFAAVGIARWLAGWPSIGAIAALTALVIALPAGVMQVAGNVAGNATSAGAVFAKDPAMWAAVRKFVPLNARVANNPDYLPWLAPWPINISWALLANRRSCWAGFGLAVALVPLPKKALEDSSNLFIRVFNGWGTAEDVTVMAKTYGCDVILVTAYDGAWARDPFVENPLYRLAETQAGAWRIYIAADRANPGSP